LDNSLLVIKLQLHIAPVFLLITIFSCKLMAGVNKVILLGNLGSDPEIRHLDGGSMVARFNIATSESYTNRNGERVDQTEWHRIELWDNLAKVAEQYLKKGNQVYVEGKIKTETWKDKDGAEKSGVRIRATSMTLVGGRPGGGDGTPSEGGMSEAPVSAPRQQAAPVASSPAPARAAAQPAPQARRQPEPTPFDGGNDNDDLPF
jgi:single-strand DNA-binding protein